MNVRPALKGILLSVALLGLAGTALRAQWSIGPASPAAGPGKHRYLFLVFANPVPGREAEFNDWYTNTHLGDLVQLPGWTGAQRFRIVSDIQPRIGSAAGYRHGYLVIWDLFETNAETALNRMTNAIRGGKSRRSLAFDYTPGSSASAAYEEISPRIARPDRNPAGVVDPSDDTIPRMSRYAFIELLNPVAGKEAELNEFANRRIKEVLALPGWVAAQRFHLTPGRTTRKPQHMIIWEIEARNAQVAHEGLTSGIKNGKVSQTSAVDASSSEFVYWEPISPYVTKEDFTR